MRLRIQRFGWQSLARDEAWLPVAQGHWGGSSKTTSIAKPLDVPPPEEPPLGSGSYLGPSYLGPSPLIIATRYAPVAVSH